MKNAAIAMAMLAALLALGAGYIRGKFAASEILQHPDTTIRTQALAQRRLYYLFYTLASLGLASCVAGIVVFSVLGVDPAYARWAASGTGALLLTVVVLAAGTHRSIPRI